MSNLDMFDDFGSDTGSEMNFDFKIEQRSTDRHLKEINSSGYRDGHQNFMENESLIQSGFDRAYKIFYKLAFLTGKTKSLAFNSISPLGTDSAFLAKIAHKIESIEKYNFKDLIQWKLFITYNTNETQNVEPKFEELEKVVSYFETQLSTLIQSILAYNTTKNPNELININSLLDNLKVSNAQSNEQHENNELNDFIQNLNIKS